MSKESLVKIIKNPYNIIVSLGMHNLLTWMPDDQYIKLVWKARFGTRLDLKNPQTFSEKIQWLKIYDHRPEYTQMVDKYRVRAYIKEKIGEDYLIPLLGVWDTAEEIDYNDLPNRFVLKCNHDSGSVLVCKEKKLFNQEAAKKKLNERLKIGTYWPLREWAYKNVKPCIVAEQFMESERGRNLLDYKFYCFNGEPKFLYVGDANFVGNEKHDLLSFFNLDWSKAPFGRPAHGEIPYTIEKPEKLDEMIRIARVLSHEIPFVRVDLYYIKGKIYFSELTFYPGSGFGPFKPDEWEKRIGSWIKLPLEEMKS